MIEFRNVQKRCYNNGIFYLNLITSRARKGIFPFVNHAEILNASWYAEIRSGCAGIILCLYRTFFFMIRSVLL